MLLPPIGYSFEDRIPNELQDLVDKGYLEICEYSKVSCIGRESVSIADRMVGCGHEFPYSSRDEVVKCPSCDNEYLATELSDKAKFITEIVKVNLDKIVVEIIQKIRDAGCNVEQLEGYLGHFIVDINNDLEHRYLVIFDGYTIQHQTVIHALQSNEGLVLIKLFDSFSESLPETVLVLNGLEIICNGFMNFKYLLRDVIPVDETIKRLEKVSKVENEIIEKSHHVTWQAVENEISNFFLEQIRTRVLQKYRYKRWLEAYPIFRRISVNSGGAGNPDKITIDLLDYLNEIFSDNFTADAKCYTSTVVNHTTMEKVLHHLSKDRFDSRRVVVLATTNKVTCWEDVIAYKVSQGRYHLLIFNAKIIAEIVVHLEFADEFLALYDSCVKEDGYSTFPKYTEHRG